MTMHVPDNFIRIRKGGKNAGERFFLFGIGDCSEEQSQVGRQDCIPDILVGEVDHVGYEILQDGDRRFLVTGTASSAQQSSDLSEGVCFA